MSTNSVIIIGIEKVGKSSLLRRFRTDEFNQNENPTLGTQISKIIINNTNFIFYDLGGQPSLRKSWYNKSLSPKAIVFVVDCIMPLEQQLETQKEFKNVLDFFYSNKKAPPLLILCNKIDLCEEISPYYLKELFFNIRDGINYHFGYCSAKTGQDVKENFQWLIGEMIKFGL